MDRKWTNNQSLHVNWIKHRRSPQYQKFNGMALSKKCCDSESSGLTVNKLCDCFHLNLKRYLQLNYFILRSLFRLVKWWHYFSFNNINILQSQKRNKVAAKLKCVTVFNFLNNRLLASISKSCKIHNSSLQLWILITQMP